MIALTGCYSPELAECRVACASDGDCGDGQTCHPEGLCAGEGVSCNGADAAVTADTPAPDGPPPQTSLRLKIMDMGSVQVAGGETCESMDCTFSVDQGVAVMLVATPANDRIFEKWEEACVGQSSTTCTVTPVGPELKVTAKFKREMP